MPSTVICMAAVTAMVLVPAMLASFPAEWHWLRSWIVAECDPFHRISYFFYLSSVNPQMDTYKCTELFPTSLVFSPCSIRLYFVGRRPKLNWTLNTGKTSKTTFFYFVLLLSIGQHVFLSLCLSCVPQFSFLFFAVCTLRKTRSSRLRLVLETNTSLKLSRSSPRFLYL